MFSTWKKSYEINIRTRNFSRKKSNFRIYPIFARKIFCRLFLLDILCSSFFLIGLLLNFGMWFHSSLFYFQPVNYCRLFFYEMLQMMINPKNSAKTHKSADNRMKPIRLNQNRLFQSNKYSKTDAWSNTDKKNVWPKRVQNSTNNVSLDSAWFVLYLRLKENDIYLLFFFDTTTKLLKTDNAR